MYFLIILLTTIFLLGIIFYNLIKIILEKNMAPYKIILNVAMYFIALVTLANVLIAIYSFFVTKNKMSMIGDKGIKGPKGKKGS